MKTVCYNHQDGEQQEYGYIIDYLPIYIPACSHLPYCIEGCLDVHGKIYQCIEQQQYTYTQKHSAFSVLQVALHKVKYCNGDFRTKRFQYCTKTGLY